jgi:hypothetical protein
MRTFADFAEVWLADFEFHQPDGERPHPLCLVAHEWREGRTVRWWLDTPTPPPLPPYPTGPDALFVSYYASAEMGPHLALGWSLPAFVLDLYAEFRCLTNGLPLPCGTSLLGALTALGIDAMGAAEKAEMRALAQRGGPWTGEERKALLEYCESDVRALTKLLPALLPRIDFPRALLRGRAMRAMACIEHAGVPLDVDRLHTLRVKWPALQDELIRRVDAQYGVFEGRSFRAARWATWLARQRIAWPLLPSGQLALDADTFKEMAKVYPAVNPMKELRASLSQLRLEQLAVGRDGRNRTILSAFGSKTGRNQPSNARGIFGPAVWLRHLIRPEPGCGLAYIDWSQQEFAIGAALSGDTAMCEAYSSGDPYLSFAKQAGAAPAHATRVTHGATRDQFKACVLAVQYGMGADSLAYRIGQTPSRAKVLLEAHRRTYRRFWDWSDSAVDYALLHQRLFTSFGWNLHLNGDANLRSLRNFPMQSNGAEMLRLACCLATERGIEVCAPVHDAVLIHAPLDQLDQAVTATQECLRLASEAVLDGFALRTEAKLFRYPHHYEDERGITMWQLVWDLLGSDLPTSGE